jgi:hypothetical protein
MKPELNPHSATRAASRAGTGHPASRARTEPAHRAAGVRERSRTLAREPAAPVTVRHHRGRACAQVTAVIWSLFLGVFAVIAEGSEPRRGHVIYSGVSAALETMPPS